MKANIWLARGMALLALGVLIATLIGLERVPSDSLLRQMSLRFGLWAVGVTLLWGSLALVLWPQQLVARNAVGIGTRRPGVARAFGCFGTFVGSAFLVGAAHGKGRFEGGLLTASLVCSGLVVWWALSRLRRTVDQDPPCRGASAREESLKPGGPPNPASPRR